MAGSRWTVGEEADTGKHGSGTVKRKIGRQRRIDKYLVGLYYEVPHTLCRRWRARTKMAVDSHKCQG